MNSIGSKPTDGVLGDVVIANNTLIGKSPGVSRTAISVYPGAGSTTRMTNINSTGNVATKWDTVIQGYYLRGGTIANNVGKTFTPAVNAAMPYRLVRNTGYIPFNALAPAVPASNAETRNNYGYPVLVTITGGKVTAIRTGSFTGHLTATGLTAGQVVLPAGWYIAITHSGAPTWTWEGIQ